MLACLLLLSVTHIIIDTKTSNSSSSGGVLRSALLLFFIIMFTALYTSVLSYHNYIDTRLDPKLLRSDMLHPSKYEVAIDYQLVAQKLPMDKDSGFSRKIAYKQ